MDFILIKRAILSVTQKDGLIELATFLHKNMVELVSTGGTLTVLHSAGIPVTAVSSVTGFPEILGGRVKTIHPNIHAGILADKQKTEHTQTLESFGIQPFDLVCVNLYDFEEALMKKLTLYEMVEEIDIGGPCMLRAAAKNFHSVLVIPNPTFYAELIEGLSTNSMHVSLALRKKMAAQAFKITSNYDNIISTYLFNEIIN